MDNVLYALNIDVPPEGVVVLFQDGKLSQETIECQYSTKGPGVSIKELRYIVSGSGAEKPYSGPIPIDPNWTWVEFRLYDDGDVLLTSERIPILKVNRLSTE
jgi:hypothetical protein